MWWGSLLLSDWVFQSWAISLYVALYLELGVIYMLLLIYEDKKINICVAKDGCLTASCFPLCGSVLIQWWNGNTEKNRALILQFLKFLELELELTTILNKEECLQKSFISGFLWQVKHISCNTFTLKINCIYINLWGLG